MASGSALCQTVDQVYHGVNIKTAPASRNVQTTAKTLPSPFDERHMQREGQDEPACFCEDEAR